MRAHRSQRGFSSIRMLCGTALVGAVLRVVSPHVEVSGRLDLVSRALASELQKARLRAIAEDRCYQINFSSPAGTFQVASKRMVAPCGTNEFVNDGDPRAVDRDGVITVDASSSPVFDTYGNAPTTTDIRLTAPNGNFRRIAVNAEGRIDGR